MRLKRLAVVLVVAGLALAFYGFSGSVSAAVDHVDVTFTIQSHQTLTIADTTVDFGPVTPDLATDPVTVAVTVKSNVAYNLTYTAPANFTQDPAGFTVPIGRLTYAVGTPFESGEHALVTDHVRTTGTTHNYDYVLTVLFDDVPGAYAGIIIYTVSP